MPRIKVQIWMNKVVKYHDEENMLIQISFPYNRFQNTSEFETPYNFRWNKPPFSVLHNPLTISQLAIKFQNTPRNHMNFSSISIRLQAKCYDFTRLFDAKHHVKCLILQWESYDSVEHIALNDNKKWDLPLLYFYLIASLSVKFCTIKFTKQIRSLNHLMQEHKAYRR